MCVSGSAHVKPFRAKTKATRSPTLYTQSIIDETFAENATHINRFGLGEEKRIYSGSFSDNSISCKASPVEKCFQFRKCFTGL